MKALTGLMLAAGLAIPGVAVAEQTPRPLPTPVPAPDVQFTAQEFTSALPEALVGLPDLLDADGMAQVLDPFMDGSPGEVGTYVVEAGTGRELYAAGADTPVVPASLLKLFTGAAVLETLGPDHTFATSAVWDSGTLQLVGGGDSMLGAGKSDPDEAMGRAGLGSLAEDVVEELAQVSPKPSGVVKVEVNVARYPDPTTTTKRETEMIETGQVGYLYPLALYGARENGGDEAERVDDTATHAGETFVKALNSAADEAGVEFEFDGLTDEPVSEEALADPLAEVESASVAAQVEFGMLFSDNHVMETLGRELAIASGHTPDKAAAGQAIAEYVETLGIDTTGMSIVDASGLSDRNRITPRQVVQLLEVADERSQLAGLLEALPVNGSPGTLEGRLTGGPFEGRLRAKTGTLSISVGLAGDLITANGRDVYFTTIVHELDGEIIEGRDRLDEVAGSLLSYRNPAR